MERLAGANKTEAEIPEGRGRGDPETGHGEDEAGSSLSVSVEWCSIFLLFPRISFSVAKERRQIANGAPVSFGPAVQPRSIRLLFSFHSRPWNARVRPLLFGPLVHSFPALYLSLNERNPIFFFFFTPSSYSFGFSPSSFFLFGRLIERERDVCFSRE